MGVRYQRPTSLADASAGTVKAQSRANRFIIKSPRKLQISRGDRSQRERRVRPVLPGPRLRFHALQQRNENPSGCFHARVKQRFEGKVPLYREYNSEEN
ncbi:MAG TPA: hypothetical protein VGO53_01090 [Steroidobacteraceae bacterium]|nr:hypothetical protein [Steroidobacteraceae bacterium]